MQGITRYKGADRRRQTWSRSSEEASWKKRCFRCHLKEEGEKECWQRLGKWGNAFQSVGTAFVKALKKQSIFLKYIN